MTKLIWMTPEAEKNILFCARSSSDNQESEDTRLLGYCIRQGHWSVFEMGNMCVEILTSRALAQQILRHRSFSFQEFSQRYAKVTGFETYPARRQDNKNRQNSIDNMDEDDKNWFIRSQYQIQDHAEDLYDEALKRGIAKEQARFLLPLSTSTKLYMNGTIRSWLHYLDLRCHESTQLEHREIANQIKEIFCKELPIIAKAKDWI